MTIHYQTLCELRRRLWNIQPVDTEAIKNILELLLDALVDEEESRQRGYNK